jgi:hypothetical protein
MNEKHERISKSWWFMLFGAQVLGFALLALLSPYFFALRWIHSGHEWIGSIAFVTWTFADLTLLFYLNSRNYFRLAVSVPCTLLGIIAASLVVWSK